MIKDWGLHYQGQVPQGKYEYFKISRITKLTLMLGKLPVGSRTVCFVLRFSCSCCGACSSVFETQDEVDLHLLLNGLTFSFL